MVGYGGEQSLDRYLAISARGVPFNVAHAVGNVALALAAGPALVRMISRYRSRFEFEWRRAPPVLARGDRRRAADRPRICRSSALAVADRWALCRAAQHEPAGAAPPRGGSSASRTPTAAFPPRPARPRAPRSRDGRRWGSRPPAATRSTFERRALADRLPALAISTACARPATSSGPSSRSDGAGVQPGGSAAATWWRSCAGGGRRSGSFEGQVNLTAFGILALRAAGAPASALARSAAWLARRAERRRRLGLPTGGRQRPGQHRRRAPGPGGGGGPGPGDSPRRLLSAARAAARRRLRARRAPAPPTPSRPPGRSRV